MAVALALAGCGGADSERAPTAPALTPEQELRALVRETDSAPLSTTVPETVREACRSAAKKSFITIVCPRLVPAGPIGVSLGNALGNGHWLVGGGDPDDLAGEFLRAPGPSQSQAERRYVRRGPHRIVVQRFPGYPPEGVNGGHVVASARRGGMLLFASVHDYEHEDVAIALFELHAPVGPSKVRATTRLSVKS